MCNETIQLNVSFIPDLTYLDVINDAFKAMAALQSGVQSLPSIYAELHTTSRKMLEFWNKILLI